MNCHGFEKRFNDLLDERLDVSLDQTLLQHTRHCDHCRATLETWTRIERGLEGCRKTTTASAPKAAMDSTTVGFNSAMWSSAVAASILVVIAGSMLVFSPPTDETNASRKVSSPIASQEIAKENIAPDPEGASNQSLQLAWTQTPWWSAVQEEQWVQRTLPAVDSVRESIAPIGRSMRQAIAILMNTPMVPNMENISPESPAIDSPLNDSSIQEQTQNSQLLAQGEKMV